MRVFQVLCGRTWGGGSVVVHAITRGLIARGDEVWVLSFDDESDRRFREIGAQIARPPVWVEQISPVDIRVFHYLWRLCRTEKFDLVATHTSKGGFLGRLAARLAGVPCIVHHAHGFSFNRELSPGARRFFVLLERFAARANDLIISVNEQHRQMAIDLDVEDSGRIVTVPNGIDIRPFRTGKREQTREKLGFGANAILIGFIGRLAPQKGLSYLLPALQRLWNQYPLAHLVIAGDGPLRRQLEREASEVGVRERVHFLGFRDDAPDLLAAFDIYVQPSLWEGHSISLIEALAAGKPIVASDIDGNREAVEHGDTGLLVAPANSAALARGLESLLHDRRLAEQLGMRARLAAEERFTQDRMVERNLAAYDSVVRRKLAGALTPSQTFGLS
jgi:glycosyltransferase involved in cell wall biosynthesis